MTLVFCRHQMAGYTLRCCNSYTAKLICKTMDFSSLKSRLTPYSPNPSSETWTVDSNPLHVLTAGFVTLYVWYILYDMPNERRRDTLCVNSCQQQNAQVSIICADASGCWCRSVRESVRFIIVKRPAAVSVWTLATAVYRTRRCVSIIFVAWVFTFLHCFVSVKWISRFPNICRVLPPSNSVS